MKQKKMFVLVIILAVISFASLSVTTSYSYIVKSKLANNTVSISTGNINSTIVVNNITNQKFVRQGDNEGMNSDSFASIDISKDNDYSVFYKITIGYTYDQNANESSLIPLEYVKCALYDGNDLVVGPSSIGDLAVYSIDSNNITGNNFILYFGSFATGVQSKNYTVKVWLDNSIPCEYDERNLSLSVNVFQETLASMNLYNLVGKVYVDGVEAVGAEVLVNHGNLKSISDASGYFINSISTGTFPINIKYNDKMYRTDLRIKNGNKALKYFEDITSNFKDYQSAAFTFCSSPLRIKMKQGNVYSTNHDFGDESVMIPGSYDMSVPEKMDVTDIPLNISVDTESERIVLSFVGD